MRRLISPLPQYAFIEWCSFEKKDKHRDNFTLTLPFTVKVTQKKFDMKYTHMIQSPYKKQYGKESLHIL